METTVSAPRASVKRAPALYRIRWRGLRLQVRASHAEVLALLRLLCSGQVVAVC